MVFSMMRSMSKRNGLADDNPGKVLEKAAAKASKGSKGKKTNNEVPTLVPALEAISPASSIDHMEKPEPLLSSSSTDFSTDTSSTNTEDYIVAPPPAAFLADPSNPANRKQRHTFTVTKDEIKRGEHEVAVLWLMREIPQAESLELRFFTSKEKEMSFEFTWETSMEDGVGRSIDMEVSRKQAIPLGTTLLTMVSELAKNIKHLTLYTGVEESSNDFNLGKLLKAFSTAGHWTETLETLEINWSRIESGTFSGLPVLPEKVKNVKLDSCKMVDEEEVNMFVTGLPLLESLQVVGSTEENERSLIEV